MASTKAAAFQVNKLHHGGLASNPIYVPTGMHEAVKHTQQPQIVLQRSCLNGAVLLSLCFI